MSRESGLRVRASQIYENLCKFYYDHNHLFMSGCLCSESTVLQLNGPADT